MSDKLIINQQREDSSLVLEFIGPIDEDSIFSDIEIGDVKDIVFDFDKVSMINSCGIREWVNFVESLAEGITFSYINCRQIIIEQINMVKGFIRDGSRVDSFYAPYYCESCDDEFKIHLKHSDVVNGKAPEVKCPKCGDSGLEFDAIEAQFFQFIK